MRGIVKQVAVSLLVLAVGFGLWVKFAPGSAAVLEKWGIGSAQGAAAPGPGAAAQTPGAPTPEAKTGAPAAGAQGGGRRGGGARVATVVVKPAGREILNDRVAALGTAAARASVIVVPQSGGRLTEVLIGSGAEVTAGQVIAKLDDSAEAIAFDKAKLARDDALRAKERNDALVKSKAVAAAQSDVVDLAAKVAELSLRSAERDLDNRVIKAPIAGRVGILDVQVGAEVTVQTVIATIEDASVLRVDFYLPERLGGQVKVGDAVQMVAVARPQEALEGRVTALDNQVDAASGSFRVQAELDNAKGVLRAGMTLSVSLKFAGDAFVSVDPLSVQWGSGGAYVWRVVEARAQKAMVRIVQRNTETVLVAGDLAEGDLVVSEGLDGLKDGAEVRIAGAPAADRAGAGEANAAKAAGN